MSWSPDKIKEYLENVCKLKGVEYVGEVEINGRKYWRFKYMNKYYLAWIVKDQKGREHFFFWDEEDIKEGRFRF